MLKYYKTQEDYNKNLPPKGIMNFNQVNVLYSFVDSKQVFTLSLSGSDRTFNLKIKGKGGNQVEYEAWKKCLTTAIENSTGKKKNLTLDNYKEFQNDKSYKFWRFLRLSEKEFLDQVETCDLLLCTRKSQIRNVSGKHKIHDIFTVISMQSQDSDDEFFVIRSVPVDQGGIVVDNWDSFKMYIKAMYSDVLFRHLFCKRDQ